ncbi:MAG: hypothetical protein ABSD73_12340 [Candidatus Bathyarchaeia archaeon]|jgi:hypothetical protein
MPLADGAVGLTITAAELATAYSTGAIGIAVARSLTVSSESLFVSLGISSNQTSFMAYLASAGIDTTGSELSLSNITSGSIGIHSDYSQVFEEEFQRTVYPQYSMDPAAVILGQNLNAPTYGSMYVTPASDLIPPTWILDPARILYYLPVYLPYFPISLSSLVAGCCEVHLTEGIGIVGTGV